MAKQAVFTMELELELRDAFAAAAERADRSASELLREMMREFVEEHAEPDDAYREFLRRKVEKARASVERGEVRTDEEVRQSMTELFDRWGRTERGGAA
ncbi:antitoxin of toxin-antitoxin stability system [Aquibium sp. ELW1220]|uniref:antitoxin of toxin-antitoxin stability system n=1 Tax=Aquibium sp. ELW1220 TaxID=2976766 RepID=UPI0025B15E1D|nr:antitoxin of toxin-antitoxin stability system [Aquibium sp. ELW1220]MDN2583575.1 antitoxin of toxin-antitoxin stability system [Aquibium sp. ELW1220]